MRGVFQVDTIESLLKFLSFLAASTNLTLVIPLVDPCKGQASLIKWLPFRIQDPSRAARSDELRIIVPRRSATP